MDLMQKKAAAFKVGFLTRLAHAGVTPEAFVDQIKAAGLLDTFGGGAMDIGRAAAGLGGSGATGLMYGAMAAPVVLGSAAGMGHALMAAPSESGIESLRKAEELALLQRLTGEIKERSRRQAR